MERSIPGLVLTPEEEESLRARIRLLEDDVLRVAPLVSPGAEPLAVLRFAEDPSVNGE